MYLTLTIKWHKINMIISYSAYHHPEKIAQNTTSYFPFTKKKRRKNKWKFCKNQQKLPAPLACVNKLFPLRSATFLLSSTNSFSLCFTFFFCFFTFIRLSYSLHLPFALSFIFNGHSSVILHFSPTCPKRCSSSSREAPPHCVDLLGLSLLQFIKMKVRLKA